MLKNDQSIESQVKDVFNFELVIKQFLFVKTIFTKLEKPRKRAALTGFS